MSRVGTQLWNNPITQTGGPQQTYGGANAGANATQQPSAGSTQPLNSTQQQFPVEGQPSQYTEYADPDCIDVDIYGRAIRVSSPRAADDSVETPECAIMRKKVVRRVEVPFTRQVKVPTQTVQIVSTMVDTKVPVKKLVQVPGFKTVDETYTEYEEREAVREKEIWVKKIVPEKYIERVPIQRVRQVQKPTTVIKEVDDFEIVSVPSTKKVMVPGYRVDEVQDSKVVEVEEEQEYHPRYEAVGQPTISATRDLGRLTGSRLARTAGEQVYHQDHPSLREIDADSDVNGPTSRGVGGYVNAANNSRGVFAASGQAIMNGGTTTTCVTTDRSTGRVVSTNTYGPGQLNGTSSFSSSSYNNQCGPVAGSTSSFYRPSSPNSRNLNIQATSQLSATQNSYGRAGGFGLTGTGVVNAATAASAGAFLKQVSAGATAVSGSSGVLRQLGLSVDETHTRHTDGTGVLVSNVERGSLAARAGFQIHDVITTVAGRPTTTVADFVNLVGGIPGPVVVTINRDGRRNITLNLYK